VAIHQVDVEMRSVVALFAVCMLVTWTSAKADCPGNPDALGTARVITVDPNEHPRVGSMQYPETLPLNDKEVVLTFDDGPIPLYTNRILGTLAAECVKATFFIVGRQARAYPAEVRKVYNEGHTIGTHSQTHPLIFTRLSIGAAEQEIDQGIASVSAALGDPRALAPFFRFPGLGRSHAIEAYLSSHGIMTWSADFPADDWTHISGQEVMRRALERLEHRGKGILLLHDIQPATALMLPQLLRELKERGYHVVQVVPAGPERPKSVTQPEAWVLHKPKPVWPTVLDTSTLAFAVPSAQSFGWPHPFRIQIVAPMPIPPTLVAGLGLTTERAPTGSGTSDVRTTSNGRFMVPTAPFESFGEPADLSEVTYTIAVEEPAAPLVATEETLSAMITPLAAPVHPRPRPSNLKVRRTASTRASNAATTRPQSRLVLR
jgi:peptidoglycan/xylan/chitin deacetylase (PgdA/CDA1 family)